MDTERMIRELRRTAKKHQNDVLHTFDTDISAMCTDVANRLEELNQSQKEIRNKAIDDCIKRIKIASENCIDEKGWFNVHISYFDDLAEQLKVK